GERVSLVASPCRSRGPLLCGHGWGSRTVGLGLAQAARAYSGARRVRGPSLRCEPDLTVHVPAQRRRREKPFGGEPPVPRQTATEFRRLFRGLVLRSPRKTPPVGFLEQHLP